MPTFNNNILPDTTGRDLGSPTQQFDAHIKDLTLYGDVDFNGATLSGTFTGDVHGNADTATTATSATHSSRRDKGFYNAIYDLLLPIDGTSDCSTLVNTFIAANPGATILFPRWVPYNTAPVDYRFASSINASSEGCTLMGDSGASMSNTDRGGVKLKFDSGITGIVVENIKFDASDLGQGVVIKNLRLKGGDPWTPSSAATYVLPLEFGGTNDADGIRVYGHGVVIEGCTIENFGRHGINIDTAGYSGNANCFRVMGNRCLTNRGSGIHTIGVDSNAGLIMNNDCTGNQLWGFADNSFLGNTYISNHTDINHFVTTTPGATKTISNSARAANVVTLTTSTNHGLSFGSMIQVAGTGSSTFNSVSGIPQFTVLSVPSATTFTYYMVGADKVSGADTGTVAEYPGALNWVMNVPSSSITSASTSLTTSSAFFGAQHLKCLVLIPGAGAAGADLVAKIVTFVTSTNVTISVAAGTTVSNITSKLLVDGGGFRSIGSAQLQASFLGNYAESSQPYNKFGVTVKNMGGDNGAGTDFSDGSFAEAAAAGVLRIDLGGNVTYRTGNENLGLTFNYRPGSTTNQNVVRTIQKWDATEQYRETFSVGGYTLSDSANSLRNAFGHAATATWIAPTTNNAQVRFGFSQTSQVTGQTYKFYSGGSVVADVDTTGLGTFNGGVKAGASGTTITQTKVYSQSLDVASVAANSTAEQTFTVTGLTTADKVYVNKPSHTSGLIIGNVRVSAADTLAITFANITGSPIDPAAETYQIVALRS